MRNRLERNMQILETHSDLNTYGKKLDFVFIDGETYSLTPKPIPSRKEPEVEESEQSKNIRKEIYGQFRAYGSSMPIRWREME